jgi:hypothetical protein
MEKDIGYPKPQRKSTGGIYKSFLKHMAKSFEKVFVLAGKYVVKKILLEIVRRL